MEYARPSLKHARSAASASATSRKNKLQRCSVCGGLGHKSRTCPERDEPAKFREDSTSPCSSPGRRSEAGFSDNECDDISDARAAYVLVDMAQAPKTIDLSMLMPHEPPHVEEPCPPLAPPPTLAPPPALAPPPSVAPPLPMRPALPAAPPLMPPAPAMHGPMRHHLNMMAPVSSPLPRWHPYADYARHLLMT